jgi:hypothetical protein
MPQPDPIGAISDTDLAARLMACHDAWRRQVITAELERRAPTSEIARAALAEVSR